MQETGHDDRRRGFPPPMRALTLLCAAALLAACTASGASGSNSSAISLERESSAYTGVVLDTPYRKPDVDLVATDGKPYNLARNATAPVTLVFFGYTSCTDECPAMLANVASALQGLETDERRRVQTVFITTDPRRDTPKVIRSFLDGFDPAFTGLTGSPQKLEAIAADLGIAVTGVTRLPGGGYDVGHSSQLIGFAPDGRGRVVWLPDKVTVPGLREDLRRLLGETTGPTRNPDVSGRGA